MYKVLIADDEQTIREGLKSLIDWEEFGLELLEPVSNGKQALVTIRKEAPDILISDMEMPYMSGLDLFQNLFEMGSAIKKIVVSSYDDFEYTKRSFLYGVENYILKPVDETELTASLKNVIDKLDRETEEHNQEQNLDNIVTRNLLCQLTADAYSSRLTLDKLNQLGVYFDSSTYFTAVCKVINEESMSAGSPLSAKNQIIEVLKKHLPGHPEQHIFIDNSGYIIVIIGDSFSSMSIKRLKNSFQKCISYIHERVKTDTFISLGTMEEPCLIWQSYQNAVNAQRYIYIYPSNTCIAYDQILQNSSIAPNSSYLDYSSIEAYIKDGDIGKLDLFFEDISDKLVGNKTTTIESVHSILIEILTAIIGIIHDYDLDTDGILGDKESIFHNLFNNPHILDTLHWLHKLVVETRNQLSSKKSQPLSLIQEIVNYVDMNYTDEDICLKTIAARFAISSSYLGQLFKKKTGVLFSEYLHEKRLTQIKAMLLNSTYSARDIAKKYGYSDSNYFYKVFKKYVGCYPTEFVENNKTQ